MAKTISKKAKEASGVYQALNKSLQDDKYGKINACYVISEISGTDFKTAVIKYKAETKASAASLKQGIFCARLVSRAKMDEDKFQALRIYLERYAVILPEMGFKPRIHTRKTWVRIERAGCFGPDLQAAPEMALNF